MQQVICECGNKVDLPDERSGGRHRCTYCGRKIYANETDEEAELRSSMHDAYPQPSLEDEKLRAIQPAHQNGDMLETDRSAETDPEATIIHANPTRITAHSAKVSSSTSSTVPANHDDFVLNDQQPADDDSDIHPSTTGSGIKYDLTQRVMRAIAKPATPIVPFTGTGEYGIHRILRVHQRGGMGRILVGYDQYLKREVAIKELHPDVAEDESIVRRFIGEAEITAQLEHPGVIPIHRIGQGSEGLPYYTMKMIKGETLQDAIKAYHRKPSKPDLLNLVRRLVSVSKTIAFAHSKGVIHRDLKPANVMLGEHSETLVMDWGLAKPYNQESEETYISVIHRTKQSRPELTMVGAIVGTPAFMSPEQANAEDNRVGPLSDVFSLGTVLYYMLAGQTAFSGRSTQEVLSKVRACNPTPPSQIKANVPHALEKICLKAMAKLPENRYQGATEFADDLCRWLDNEPIIAEQHSWFFKIRRWLLYYHTSFSGIIWVLILSLLFSCIGVWIVERSRPSSDVPVSEKKVRS